MNSVSRLLGNLFDSVDSDYYQALISLRKTRELQKTSPLEAGDHALHAAAHAERGSLLQVVCVKEAHEAFEPNGVMTVGTRPEQAAALHHYEKDLKKHPVTFGPGGVKSLLRRAEQIFVDGQRF